MKGGEEMIKKALIFSLALLMSLVVSFNTISAQDNIEKTETETETTETKKHPKGKKHKKVEIAEPENAIGKDVAKEIVLNDVGLSADQIKKIKAHVSNTEDGIVIYKIKFIFEGQKYSYQIDALTGTIINKSNEEFTKKSLDEFKAKEKPTTKNKDKNSDSNSLEPSL